MGCKVEACAECTQKCLLAHGKNKKSPPVVTSFFKVMIGDQFSKLLFLPPKFSPTVSSLIDQSTFLEDSSGQQWKVTLSDVNGSLAFQQGWNSFSVDHGLEVGDFLVFKYIIGSHFFVKIYNKTGCEQLDFCEKRKQKKRGRTCRNSTAKNGPCKSIDTGSMNKQGSSVSGSDVKISQSQCEMTDGEQIKKVTENMSNYDDSNGRPRPVSEAGYMEEPYYLINRDLGKGEDRSTIFDLSNFEMWKNKSSTDGSDKVTAREENFPLRADISLRSQVEGGSGNVDPIAEEVVTRVLPSDASEFEMEENNDIEEMDKIVTVSDKDSCNSNIPGHLLITPAAEPGKDGENSSDMSSRVIKRCKIAEASLSENDQVVVSQTEISQTDQLKITGMSKSPDDPVALSTQNCQSAEMTKIVKQEPVDTALEFCSYREMIQEIHGEDAKVIKREIDEVHASVKIETVDLVSMSSPIAAISCLIAMGSQSFLELSVCLPSSSYNRRAKKERKVVLLRDSEMRLWPVLYHERPGCKILTSGWEAFSKANNIQPGDECVLGIESETEGIYGVRIVRKQDEPASRQV